MKSLLIAAALLGATDVASAFCTAPPPRECDAYFRAHVVVLGTVVADETKYSPSGFAEELTYRILVEKTLRGQAHRIVHISTGNDSGGLRLMRGERRVLFGERRDGKIYIGCDEWDLSLPTNADAIVSSIERLKKLPPSTPASIEIEFIPAEDEPIPPDAVRVYGESTTYGGTWVSSDRFKAVVPPGTYSVSIDPAFAKQTIYSLGWANPQRLELAPGQCAQLQFQVGLE